jgi:hypothetical protein
MFLCPRPKYLNEWWKSGSGEETPLNMELLQVAYSPPEMVDPIPSTATHVRPMYQSSAVTSPLTGPQACTKCLASWEIARRAVVALRDCAVHMEASSQFAQWSAGQSQRVIKACRQLCLEHRKIGRQIGLEDLTRLGTKDARDISGAPAHNQATTYPSADGIDWNLFPYEDTQGPLLSPAISQRQESIPNHQDPPPPGDIPSTTQMMDQDGFNIDRWAAAVPGVVTTSLKTLNPPPPHAVSNQVDITQPALLRFADVSVQVPSLHGPHFDTHPVYHEPAELRHTRAGLPAPDHHAFASPPAGHLTLPDIIMAQPNRTSSGTDISSAGLSSNSSGHVSSSSPESEAASDMDDESDVDGGSDMGGSEYGNEEAIAAAYTGD